MKERTSVHEKNASPQWGVGPSFDVDKKHRGSLLRCEVWTIPDGTHALAKPLGFVELALSSLNNNIPFDFNGALTHVEGTYPPPDKLPPMTVSMRITWVENATTTVEWPTDKPGMLNPPVVKSVSLGAPMTEKEVYRELRKMFPEVPKHTLSMALKMNDFNISSAADYIVDKLVGTIVESSPMASNYRVEAAHMSKACGSMDKSFIIHAESKNYAEPAPNSFLRPKINHKLNEIAPSTALPSANNGYIDATRVEGRRKALLIGINYTGTKKQLNGCHDDVERMRKLITEVYGFPNDPNFMTVLTDDNKDTRLWPTRKNILLACQWLVHDAQPGDVLYFHFSGHGSQQKDLHGTECDGYDETIMPQDYRTKGHIVDDELYEALVHPLPSGVKMFALMDCCHSGSGLDLPFAWNIQNSKFETEFCPKYAQGDVILFAGCQDEQTSADVHIPRWGSGGAMTMSLVTTLAQDPYGKTYTGLIRHVHKCMNSRGLGQLPQMSTTQRFSENRVFDFLTCFLNTNKMIGQDMTLSTNATQRDGRTYIPRPLRVSKSKA